MRRKIYILFILSVTMAMTVGCGSDKSGSGGNDNPFDDFGFEYGDEDLIPPVTDPDPSLTEDAGASVNFVVTDKSAFDTYLGWTSNTPTDLKININVKKYFDDGGADKGFGGYVKIKFKDNGVSFSDTFSSMWLGGYPAYNTVETNSKNHRYNLLSKTYPAKSGQPYVPGTRGYHGFFETTNVQRLIPPYYGQPIFSGAIILVIDKTTEVHLNDGQPPTVTSSGSVYFKNIIAQYPMGPLPYTSCWFISAGPYDCRTWRHDGKVQTKRSLYPDSEYTKLGNFYGLDMQKAFNNQITN